MGDDTIQEQINSALKRHLEECNEQTKNQLTGVFLYGLVTGIVLSYSGILGFSTGACAGMFIRYRHNTASTVIIETIVKRFSTSWAEITKKR
jgi:hypothetical protein